MISGFFLAVSLLASQASDSVPMPVQYEQAYMIDTRIHRTRTTGDTAPRVMDEHWRVEVQPTEEGFKTVWRDPDAGGRTDLRIEANERLQPLRLSNLDTVWSERGPALLQFGANRSDIARTLTQALPQGARQTLLVTGATMIATGQGLDLVVGEPLVQRLPGQRVGNAPTISILSTLTLVSVDEPAGKAVVTWTTALDPKEVEAGLPGLVRAVLGISEEESAKLPEFDEILNRAVMTNRRECRYDIDLSSGLAGRTSCHGVVSFTVGDHVEKTEDTLEATQGVMP